MAQCKLCKTKMSKNNFLRHLRTNLHLNNEKIYQEKQISSDQKNVDNGGQYNWEIYAKQHPWLISDPIDSKYAYCKYCEKRVIYGSSAAKRSTHENSSQHKYNENEFKSRQRKVIYKRKEQNKINNANKGKEEAENVAEQTNDDGYDVEEEDGADEGRNEETSDDEENENCVDEEDLSEKDAVDDDNDDDNSEKGTKNDRNDESEDEIDSKKRVYRLTEEWLKQYTWCKRYNKDPTNFFFCIYCKIPLRAASSRPKHQRSATHIAAEEEYLKGQEKKQTVLERKESNENDNATFVWSIPLKGNSNMYSCKYCRVGIPKNYSKKNHAASRIHQINEGIYKSTGQRSSSQEEDNSKPIRTLNLSTQQRNIATSKKGQTFAKVIIKVPSTLTLIKQWQKKFSWLTYKRNELRSNYGYCKICDCSLYLRSFKHVLRHVRSGRHVRLTKAKNKQKQEQDQKDDFSTKINSRGPKIELPTSPDQIKDGTLNKTNLSNVTSAKIHESPKYSNYRSTIIELKKRFSWIESSDKPNYGYCRFCSTNIPLKILFLRNHSNSLKHRSCVKSYCGEDEKIPNKSNDDDEVVNKEVNVEEKNTDDDDVMIVEENNEEILISEQDENWTVKSETMDEHEELDFLLQRSFNSSQNRTNAEKNVRKVVGVEDQPPPKRLKRSQSFKRLNDKNSSLVASLLTTPLTLASCLGPFIQQQIQQQVNNTHQLLVNTSTPMTPAQKTVPLLTESDNTIDLFFKSVSETMKKLPIDIAAEGKVRVMQIICDLELQALKRDQSVRTDIVSSNTSGINYQPASTSSVIQLGCNSGNDNNDRVITDQPLTCNDTIITQINAKSNVSPPVPSTTLPINKSVISTSTGGVNQSMDKLPSATSTSPIIGLVDRNCMQTIQLKQVSRNTTNPTVTTVANTGIRCIPFKNLSQTVAVGDQTNSKATRIQMPLNVTSQSVGSNETVINFRNIQISKRLSATPTPTPTSTSVNILNNNVQQQKSASPQASPITNKSPQRTFITNIQPQLQRWGSTLNGTASHPTSTSSSVNQQQSQMSSQQTSTSIANKN